MIDKSLMYPENRIALWLKGKKLGPFSLELNPTNRCNLNCLACGSYVNYEKNNINKNKVDKHNKQKEVLTDRYLKLIEEASKLGVVSVCISGGEPLIRKDILEIMLKIKEYGMQGELNTNGILLTENISKTLVDNLWDRIVVSLDGPNEKINDYLRSGGFNKVIKHVEFLSHFKRKQKSSKLLLTIATILTNKNYNHLFKMLKLCKKLGVENFRLQELLPRSERCKELELNTQQRKEFQENLVKLIKVSKKLKINTNFENFLQKEEDNTRKKNYCFSPFYELVISGDGGVKYCIISPKSFDNIYNKSLQEIWFGKEMEDFRKKLLNKNFPNFCKNCCSPRIFDMKKINEKIKTK